MSLTELLASLSINSASDRGAMDEFYKIFDPQKHALATDSEGTSLLMHIIWVMEEWHCTRYFIDGINPTFDYTPLLSVCDDLLKHGADVNEEVDGTSLLGRCLSPLDEVKPELVHLLLRHGANVQCCNWRGESAFKWLLEAQTHYPAIDERRTRVVQLLLEFGANANEFFYYRTVPLDLNENTHGLQHINLNESICALLRKHGGLTGDEHRQTGRILQAVKYHQPQRIPTHLYKYILSFAFHNKEFYDRVGVPAFWHDFYFIMEFLSKNIQTQKDKDVGRRTDPKYKFFWNKEVPEGIIRHIGHGWGWYSENVAAILDDPNQLAQSDYKLKLL